MGLALITLILIFDRNGNVGLCICAAIFHETGHILSLLLFRDSPKKINIGFFGIRIERTEKTDISYLKEAVIALSGPLFNIVVALITLFSEGSSDPFVMINAFLAVFNLLPLAPLDGGRVLYHLLCRFSEDSTAKRITKTVTAVGLIPLAVTGAVIFIRDRSSFSLLLSSVYISFSLLSFPYN